MNTLEFISERVEGQKVNRMVYSDTGLLTAIWTDKKFSVNGIAVVNKGKGNSLEPATLDLNESDVKAIDVATDVECNFNMGTCNVDCVLVAIILEKEKYGFVFPRNEAGRVRRFADAFNKSRM